MLSAEFLRGEIAAANFYNYAIDPQVVLANYNAMLHDPDRGVVRTSGAARPVSARPSDVSEGGLEGDGIIWVIHERDDVLDDELRVDIAAHCGERYGNGDAIGGKYGLLPAGTELTSYLLHLDPQIDEPTEQSAVGSITFSRDMQGILIHQASLEATDALLGSIGTYTVAVRALVPLRDSLIVSDELRTLTLSLNSGGSGIVQLRVLTTAVPEPSTSVAVMIGFALTIVSTERTSRVNLARLHGRRDLRAAS